MAKKPKTRKITLEAHTDIIDNLLNNEEKNITMLKETLGLNIILIKNDGGLDKFSLKNN